MAYLHSTRTLETVSVASDCESTICNNLVAPLGRTCHRVVARCSLSLTGSHVSLRRDTVHRVSRQI